MSLKVLSEIIDRPGPVIDSSARYLPVECFGYLFDSKNIKELLDCLFITVAEHSFDDGIVAK
jgi:hypothetical protein